MLLKRLYELFKRVIDIALALALIIATLPILVIALALVALTSRGPVIYRQVRTGLGHRQFLIYKIRTMFHDCERHTGPRWSTTNDPRVTPIGRILRRTHLDELPQLWNVLQGEMSLIGPRPERPEIIVELEKLLPDYARRLEVRPGVTGLAQINLPPDTDHDSVRRKLILDLHYIDTARPLDRHSDRPLHGPVSDGDSVRRHDTIPGTPTHRRRPRPTSPSS